MPSPLTRAKIPDGRMSALVLSLTTVPALIATFLNRPIAEKDVRIVAWAKVRYGFLLQKVLARPRPVLAGGALIFILAAGTFPMVVFSHGVTATAQYFNDG